MNKIGVVFLNLGTPRSPTPDQVGRYLGEFLMDPFVIQIPTLLRFILVRGIIVPFRKKKSAKNYQKIWTQQGSPLMVETQKAALALQKELGDHFQVAMAMRYGEPNLQQARESLKNCQKIIFFPQYPQYAESTFETSVREFQKIFKDKETHTISPYFDHPDFVKAYQLFLDDHLKDLDVEHVLMSFHGLPETHITKTDPTQNHCLKKPNCCETASAEVLKTCYRAQCFKNAKLISSELTTPWSVSFQSRLGRQKWIEPSTEDSLDHLVQKGIKKLAVICPGFPVDGLETLEEIAIAGREQFIERGGESYHYLPCLNSDPHWIQACAKMVQSVSSSSSRWDKIK